MRNEGSSVCWGGQGERSPQGKVRGVLGIGSNPSGVRGRRIFARSFHAFLLLNPAHPAHTHGAANVQKCMAFADPIATHASWLCASYHPPWKCKKKQRGSSLEANVTGVRFHSSMAVDGIFTLHHPRLPSPTVFSDHQNALFFSFAHRPNDILSATQIALC